MKIYNYRMDYWTRRIKIIWIKNKNCYWYKNKDKDRNRMDSSWVIVIVIKE
jgi:hypothetical protein